MFNVHKLNCQMNVGTMLSDLVAGEVRFELGWNSTSTTTVKLYFNQLCKMQAVASIIKFYEHVHKFVFTKDGQILETFI